MHISGNLLLQHGVLCHQVNCQRLAGAGLAKQIRHRWPIWYLLFQQHEPQLGACWIWEIGKHGIAVASLYGQANYGRGAVQTDYEALGRALDSLRQQVGERPIFVPYGMGAGLAGGDWTRIESLIAHYIPQACIVKKE